MFVLHLLLGFLLSHFKTAKIGFRHSSVLRIAFKSHSRWSFLFHSRSLYSIKREHIAGRELSFLTRPPSGQHDSSSLNIEHLVEKNYIIDSKLTGATPEKFPKVIMRHFHRVSSTDNDIMYGMPRPPTRAANPLKKIMDDMRREPSIVRIEQYPSLQEPIPCPQSDQFCEILGPSSCQKCIECTNRHIGEELQHMTFPTIDITPDKLIYPKVSQMLVDGHRLQIRKRRMRELGVDMPFDLANFPRQKSHLSSNTCLSCKKPINFLVPPIQIPSPVKSVEFQTKKKRRHPYTART